MIKLADIWAKKVAAEKRGKAQLFIRGLQDVGPMTRKLTQQFAPGGRLSSGISNPLISAAHDAESAFGRRMPLDVSQHLRALIRGKSTRLTPDQMSREAKRVQRLRASDAEEAAFTARDTSTAPKGQSFTNDSGLGSQHTILHDPSAFMRGGSGYNGMWASELVPGAGGFASSGYSGTYLGRGHGLPSRMLIKSRGTLPINTNPGIGFSGGGAQVGLQPGIAQHVDHRIYLAQPGYRQGLYDLHLGDFYKRLQSHGVPKVQPTAKPFSDEQLGDMWDFFNKTSSWLLREA